MKKELTPVFQITFEEFQENDKPQVKLFYQGEQIGNTLNDNAYVEDGYRYHDCGHFIYLVHTGSSRVVDMLLEITEDGKKHDELERMLTQEMQTNFEEAVPLMAVMLRNDKTQVIADKPTKSLLKMLNETAMSMRIDLPPSVETLNTVITDFYKNFDLLHQNGGGSLLCDTVNKTVTYVSPVTV